jgi:hypothetical protein
LEVEPRAWCMLTKGSTIVLPTFFEESGPFLCLLSR